MKKIIICLVLLTDILFIGNFNCAQAWQWVEEGGPRYRGIGGIYIDVNKGETDDEVKVRVDFSGGAIFTPGHLFIIASKVKDRIGTDLSDMDEIRNLFVKLLPSDYHHFVTEPSTFTIHVPEDANLVDFYYYKSKATSAPEYLLYYNMLIDTYGFCMNTNDTMYVAASISR